MSSSASSLRAGKRNLDTAFGSSSSSSAAASGGSSSAAAAAAAANHSDAHGGEGSQHKRARTEPTSGGASSAAAAAAASSQPADVEMHDAQDLNTPALVVMYAPGGSLLPMEEYMGRIVEFRIGVECISTANLEVHRRNLWGTDVYTDDSDPVAILMHTGHVAVRPQPPVTDFHGIAAFFRVLPAAESYESTTRFGIKSRRWESGYQQCSIELVRIKHMHDRTLLRPIRRRPTRSRSANGDDDQVLSNSRSGARVHAMVPSQEYLDNQLNPKPPKESKFLDGLTVVYNKHNQPCFKYCLSMIADVGLNSKRWTSARLSREVFYLETPTEQFELSRDLSAQHVNRYNWKRVLPVSYGSRQDPSVPRKRGVEVVESGLAWEEIEWGERAIRVRGTVYPVLTFHSLVR